jgi:hypothetical protein
LARKSSSISTSLTEFDFSKSLQSLGPESFFRFTKQYPDHQATSAYVYRLLPTIDRKLAGVKDTNIEIIVPGEVDEERLLQAHGSGKYHLKFTDANRPKGLTEVAKCTVEIYDPKVPPILNPVELVVTAAGNDRYVAKYLQEGWTVEDGKLMPPAKQPDGNVVLAETVRDLAGRASAAPVESPALVRVIEMLDRRANGSGEEITRALALAERLQPRVDPAQVELMKVLVAMVSGGGHARPTPISEIRDTLALARELAPPPPPASSGGGFPWAELFQALPALAQFLPVFLQQFAASRQPPANVIPITAAPVAPASATAAAPPAVESPVQGETDMLGLGFGLADLKIVAEDAIDAFGRNISGGDFAHAVCCRRRGEQLYDTICQLGKEQLLEFLAMAPPELAGQVAARREEVAAWLDDFIAYGDDESADSEKTPPSDKVA